MRAALEQARIALEKGEVPVGAVLVREGEIRARAHNSPITLHDPSKKWCHILIFALIILIKTD